MSRWLAIFVLAMSWHGIVVAESVATLSATITARDCRTLTNHRPADDVAFRPGGGRDGRAVAPADLPDSRQLDPPRTLVLELRIPLRSLRDQPRSQVFGEAELDLGRVTFDRISGEVYYNEQLLDDQALRYMRARCADRFGDESD